MRIVNFYFLNVASLTLSLVIFNLFLFLFQVMDRSGYQWSDEDITISNLHRQLSSILKKKECGLCKSIGVNEIRKTSKLHHRLRYSLGVVYTLEIPQTLSVKQFSHTGSKLSLDQFLTSLRYRNVCQ